MIICELCGSANVETDEQCRVCGQALKLEHAPVAHTPTAANSAAPIPSSQSLEHTPLPEETPHRSLQMSAVSESVQSDAPPMLGGSHEEEVDQPEDSVGSVVPGFMQAGHRAQHAVPDPVQLISANDLPDWIKQIAAADTAKAEAEAQAALPHADAPATIVKRALPGETMVAAPSTNWLSKSAAQSSESPDHWDSSEIANANWGNADSTSSMSPQEYPTLVPPTAFVPSAGSSYATAKPKKRLSFSSGSPSGKPIYRQQTFQLFMLVILAAVFAVFMFV